MRRGKRNARSNVRSEPRTGRRLVALAMPPLLLSGILILTTAPRARAHTVRAKLPSISIDDVKVQEGDSGSSKLVFKVTLSRRATVTVHYRTSGGTATKKDFHAVHGTIHFGGSSASRKITVKVIGDALHEPDETLSLHLTNPTRARIVDGVGRGTILDDDVLGGAGPAFSIGDYTVTEGNLGTTDAVFDVTVSSSSSTPMTVDFATVNGSASFASDYDPAGGTLTFAPGETSKQVVVKVTGDTTAETNEKFSVNLTNAIGATIADAIGLGTITDDDSGQTANPSFTIANVTVTEGNSGTVNAVFTPTLSAPSTNTVTLNYATAPGSATANGDYMANNGTVAFNPGEVSKQIVVQVVGDVAVEPSETYSVNLSNPTNATIAGTGFGLGTITDDDARTLSIGNNTFTEVDAGLTNVSFIVTLSASSGNTVTVNYATADGSATAPSDYVSVSGTVTFNPGETTKTIIVQIAGDFVVEPNETYSVSLSNPTNATITGSGIGLGTITNDD
jgi:urease beta subunit